MTTLFEMIRQLAEKCPAPAEDNEPTAHTYSCRSCDDMTQVSQPNDLCLACTMEKARGYQALTKTGRRANGFEFDHGTQVHAVRFGEHAAVCGTKPGRRSDWSTPWKTRDITCPRCLARLAKVQS